MVAPSLLQAAQELGHSELISLQNPLPRYALGLIFSRMFTITNHSRTCVLQHQPPPPQPCGMGKSRNESDVDEEQRQLPSHSDAVNALETALQQSEGQATKLCRARS